MAVRAAHLEPFSLPSGLLVPAERQLVGYPQTAPKHLFDGPGWSGRAMICSRWAAFPPSGPARTLGEWGLRSQGSQSVMPPPGASPTVGTSQRRRCVYQLGLHPGLECRVLRTVLRQCLFPFAGQSSFQHCRRSRDVCHRRQATHSGRWHQRFRSNESTKSCKSGRDTR